MLQLIRDKSSSKVFYITLLVLMTGGLLVFGIGDYSFGGATTYVAKVGKEIITEQDFQQRFDEQRRQMRTMMRDAYQPKMFETPEFKRQLLDQLIDEALIQQAGAAAGLAVTDTRLQAEIAKIEAFQVNGKFDQDRYQLALRGSGFSPRQFEARMRRDMAVKELPAQLAASALVTTGDANNFVRLRDQTRDFRYLALPQSVLADAVVSADDEQKYFAAHAADYVTPEQVAVEYVELDGAALAPAAAPSEADLRSRYAAQAARFGTKEQHLASHILVEVAAGADAATQKSALQKAETLAAELAAGKEFAELAKASSADAGTRAAGGDLGWIEAGIMEPAFEQALLALKPGEVSAPVRTEQGYHLILLREVKPAATKSFEEVRAQLETEFAQEQHNEKLADLQDKLFTVADQANGTLEPLAKAIGGTVQTTPLFSQDVGFGIAMFPEIRAAAFSLEVKTDGLSSEPIEVSKDRMVVIRLAQHKPATPRAFDAVKPEVHALLLSERQQKANREAADAALKRLLGGETLEAIAASLGATVSEGKAVGRQGLNQDRQLLAEVFKMPRPQAGGTIHGLAEVAGKKFALLELQAVHDADPKALDAAAQTAVRDQLRQDLSALESAALRKALRARTKIEVNEDRL